MIFDNSDFRRAHAMMAGIAAAMSLPIGPRQHALAGIGAYESRGKRKTANHPARMTRIAQRAAKKRRNVQRNRRAHRG